jgi:hypothetical protein
MDTGVAMGTRYWGFFAMDSSKGDGCCVLTIKNSGTTIDRVEKYRY